MGHDDIIIGKSGESIRGKVLDKNFDISSGFGDISVKTESIAHIHFKNQTQFKLDEIRLLNSDCLTGDIHAKTVFFKLGDGTEKKIPRSAILTIMSLEL